MSERIGETGSARVAGRLLPSMTHLTRLCLTNGTEVFLGVIHLMLRHWRVFEYVQACKHERLLRLPPLSPPRSYTDEFFIMDGS